MQKIPRRNVSEIMTRGELNPSLKVCVVEGTTDRSLVRRFFQKYKIESEVYSICELNVKIKDADLRTRENGNKGRLIQLSREVPVVMENRFVAIIDMDMDEYLGVDYSSKTCWYHQFLSIDWYPLSPNKTINFLSSISKNAISKNQLEEVLLDARFITTIRAFRDIYFHTSRLPKLSRFYSERGILDREAYIERFRQQSNASRENIDEYLRHNYDECTKSYRNIIHYHDFRLVCILKLKKKGILKSSVSENSFNTIVLAFLHDTKLKKFEFWKNLQNKLS